jgi:hypothetical protein
MIDLKTSRRVVLAVAMVSVLGVSPAIAQGARDPTVAPPETGSANATGSAIGVDGMTVLMRGDRAYLVVGTRLYSPGDKVGAFRVDRITETQVWLRDGTKLVKLPRFAGIERKSLAPARRCAPPETHQNSPAAAAPCEDTPL